MVNMAYCCVMVNQGGKKVCEWLKVIRASQSSRKQLRALPQSAESNSSLCSAALLCTTLALLTTGKFVQLLAQISLFE